MAQWRIETKVRTWGKRASLEHFWGTREEADAQFEVVANRYQPEEVRVRLYDITGLCPKLVRHNDPFPVEGGGEPTEDEARAFWTGGVK